MAANCPEEGQLSKMHKSPFMQAVGLPAHDPSEEKRVKFLGILEWLPHVR